MSHRPGKISHSPSAPAEALTHLQTTSDGAVSTRRVRCRTTGGFADRERTESVCVLVVTRGRGGEVTVLEALDAQEDEQRRMGAGATDEKRIAWCRALRWVNVREGDIAGLNHRFDRTETFVEFSRTSTTRPEAWSCTPAWNFSAHFTPKAEVFL